jgi:hypothetical protein
MQRTLFIIVRPDQFIIELEVARNDGTTDAGLCYPYTEIARLSRGSMGLVMLKGLVTALNDRYNIDFIEISCDDDVMIGLIKEYTRHAEAA